MKIALITPGILPCPAVKGGAVETLIDELIKYNEKKQVCELYVFSVYNDEAFIESQSYNYTKVYYIKRNRLLSFLFDKKYIPIKAIVRIFENKVCKILEKVKFDGVIMQNEFINCKNIKDSIGDTPLILHLHNDYVNTKIKKVAEKINLFSSIITVSEYISTKVCNVSEKYKVEAIYNGVDVEKFNINKISKSSMDLIRCKLGIESKDIVIVFAGRLVESKGVKQLIEAFLKIPDDYNVKLMIIGSSFFDQKLETPYIKELKELSIKTTKIIFTGHVKYDDMPLYYSIADIGCIPSMWEEPFGLTVIEQMSMGLPLIVSDSGAIPEIVTNDSAIIIKRNMNFAESLSEAMMKLIAQKQIREEMGRCARREALKFSNEEFACKFFNFIAKEIKEVNK